MSTSSSSSSSSSFSSLEPATANLKWNLNRNTSFFHSKNVNPVFLFLFLSFISIGLMCIGANQVIGIDFPSLPNFSPNSPFHSSAASLPSSATVSQLLSQAQSLGINVNTPPSPRPSSCGSSDYHCQFYRACYSCYGNHMQEVCGPCLQLLECSGGEFTGAPTPCQVNQATQVCQKLNVEDRPAACSQLP